MRHSGLAGFLWTDERTTEISSSSNTVIMPSSSTSTTTTTKKIFVCVPTVSCALLPCRSHKQKTQPQLEGIPQPDRDALDSARWMAYDAANEYLAEQRSMRAPRRPHDPPAPSGKLLHRIEGFRHFRSVIHFFVAEYGVLGNSVDEQG